MPRLSMFPNQKYPLCVSHITGEICAQSSNFQPKSTEYISFKNKLNNYFKQKRVKFIRIGVNMVTFSDLKYF